MSHLSQASLAGILEIANDAVISIDDRHRITVFNQGAVKIFGYHANEVLGQPLNLLLPTSVAERHTRHVDDFGQAADCSRRMGSRSEIIGRRKDGTEFPAEASISKLDLNGQTVMTAILRDITERKRAEENLRHLASIVEASDDAIIATTPDLVIVSWNPGAEKMYGYTTEEVWGRPIGFLVPPECEHEIPVIREAAQRGDCLKQYETVRMRKDGRRVHVSLSISCHRDASGRITGFSGIARDITERKRAEERLHDLRMALEAAVEGIARVDRRGRYLSVNAPYAAMVGYSVEELIAMDCSRTAHLEDRERLTEAYRKMRNAGKVEVEARAVRKDGSVMHKQVVMIRTDEQGEFAGYYCFIKDITGRKQVEEQIAASLREKELLLKEIHHRVKNNLQLISSLLNLQAAQIHDERVLAMFKESQNRIRAVAFVHEKLYQSRDLARIDLAEYIRSLANHLLDSYDVGPDAVVVGIHVDDVPLDLDTAIPCCLIINELVSNMLKHAFVGGRTGRVRVDLGPCAGNRHSLVVSDNGVGFPATIDFRTTTSLGLQLVCALVEQLAGTIELERNGGTTWKITFKGLKGN
ncbi:MAG: PAS domain S-box protein [Nitrospirae bacterium]|nr:PAS domain S-box protein [Nitrospirota bacterium]